MKTNNKATHSTKANMIDTPIPPQVINPTERSNPNANKSKNKTKGNDKKLAPNEEL